MYQEEFIFPVIDTKKTGQRIKEECRKREITVKEIQRCLGLSAFQSIYDWFGGRTLPSLDNLLALSRLLGLPMEQLIVCRGEKRKEKTGQCERLLKRTLSYWKRVFRMKLYIQISRFHASGISSWES